MTTSTDTTASTKAAAVILRQLDTIGDAWRRATDYAASSPPLWPDVDRARQIAQEIAEAAAAITGGEYRPDYNGWKNRETWTASLLITNDQEHDAIARAIVADHITDPEAGPYDDDPDLDRRVRTRNAADALKDWWSEAGATHRIKTGALPFAVTIEADDLPPAVGDAWTYALAVTDWYAVADGIAEEMTTPAQDRARAELVAQAADADPGEANEPALHALNGREADHYAGGKPDECPDCWP